MENRVRRNQPLRLIRHDDGGALAGIEIRIFESAGQGQSDFLETEIRQPNFLAIAVRLDQAHLGGKAVERIEQGRAKARVLSESEHQQVISSQSREPAN